MSNVVPEGWSYSKLSEVSKVSIGLVTSMTPYYVDNGVPLIRNSDIKENKIRQSKLINLAPSFSEKHQSRSIKYRDVVTVHTGDIGTSAVVPKELDGCQGFATLNTRVKEEIIDPYYLSWFFNTDTYTNFVLSVCTGDGRSNLNLKDFVKSVIVYPPLPEQQKIAKVLTSVDEVIEKTQAQIDKLKDLKTGMMQELLTNGIGHTEFKDSPVGRIPAEWDVVTLGDVTIESAFGPRFSSDEYAPDGNFGCIRTTDMDENWDVNYSTAPLARLNFKEFEKHILVDGDLLVTRSGTCGLVDVFREQPIPMVAAAFLIRFRLTDNVIPQFVKYLMMSTDIQESVQLLASGGVQKNLSGTSLKTLKIPKPSIQEQIKIVKAIESINNRLANSNKKLSLNKKLKKALMQDLLTGKVRVKINS